MITVDEMVESGKCPCGVCSSQDDRYELASKQINKNPTTIVRIDSEIHRLLKIKAATEKTTIRVLLEGCLADLLTVEGGKRNG